MINHLRMLGAVTLHGLRTAHDHLATFLGLQTAQHYEFHPHAPWGSADDAWFIGYTKYFYEDVDGWTWSVTPERVLEWGAWTVVVESAQDGGGTTYFFRNVSRRYGQDVLDMRDRWEKPACHDEQDI